MSTKDHNATTLCAAKAQQLRQLDALKLVSQFPTWRSPATILNDQG